MPFRGFTEPELDQVDGAHLYPMALYLAEMTALLDDLRHRLGSRVMSTVQHQGRDTQVGRDYFYDQVEVRRHGPATNPIAIGFYHYYKPEERRGSWFEAWRSIHDSEPALRRPVTELVAGASEAYRKGFIGDWLDDLAEAVRAAVGL